MAALSARLGVKVEIFCLRREGVFELIVLSPNTGD